MNPELGQSMTKPPNSGAARVTEPRQFESGSLRPLRACSKLRFASSKSEVQLFSYSWSKALFGPISISEAAQLFTKQPLCQLSYAGILSER